MPAGSGTNRSGQVPPELGALTKDDAHVMGILDTGFVWFEAIRLHRARGGDENPGHELDCRGLAGAIRPQVAHDTAPFDFQGHVVHGLDDPVLGGEKRLDLVPDSCPRLRDFEILGKVINTNH